MIGLKALPGPPIWADESVGESLDESRVLDVKEVFMNGRWVRVYLVMVIVGSLATIANGGEGSPKMFLTRNGEAAAYIVLDGSPDQRNSQTAEDFVAIIERMSRARLTPTESPGLIPLYLGEPNEFSSLPFEAPALGEEEFLMRVTPEAIYLLGGTSLGTQHAAYTLLRDLGCRWVMPGDIGECLPQQATLAIGAQERREAPDFRFRDIWYAYGCSPAAAQRRDQWLRRNRMHRPTIQHGHNLTSTLSRLAPFEQRPELYALIEGERKPTQICTSNPETVALVTESIRRQLDANPNLEAYSLCPDDNADFCQCDVCRALDSGHMDRGGLPSVSDRYQVFLNQVLEGLAQSHPTVLVTTYSYNRNHTDPPQRTPVHPNTCVFVTSSAFCSAHGVGDTSCRSRQDFKSLLTEWTALTPHIYIYEYDPVPYSGGLPWPMWGVHGRSMPVYKQLGVKGVSFEGQDSWAPYFPNYYVGAQMMWDSSQDPNDVFADMVESFFQEAAADMMEYYQSLSSHIAAVTDKVEWGLVNYPKYFPPENVELCRQALQKAEEKAALPVVKKRLEMVRLSFEEMDAYLGIRRADDSITFERYKRAIDRLNHAIDTMAEINEDYLLAYVAKEKTKVAISERFGPEQGFINRWLLCGPFDNLGMEGHDRIYPPEQSIDLEATYIGKDGQNTAWKPNHTAEWRGYVDLLQEFDQTDWVCTYALCWVTLEKGPRDVLFRIGSNDSVKAFLNGKPLWDNKIERVASVDDDLVPVTLPQGTSTILLKVCQTGLNWGFYFRITERNSEGIPEGLSVASKPPK